VTRAAVVWSTTWAALEASLGEEPSPVDGSSLERLEERYRYLLGTDPGGCLVADQEGQLVGLAMSHRRGERFMLANLAVVPGCQGQGIGRSLLERSLEYGAEMPRALICSSPDPGALKRYVRAGFRLAPAMQAIGRSLGANGSASIGSVRRSDGSSDDLALVAKLDERVWSVDRSEDVAFMMGAGVELWLDHGDAYALVNSDEVIAVCAAKHRVARQVLSELLSGRATGRSLTARWLTEATPWAFEAAADAGASLKGYGAVMTRGSLRLEGAYLPSGVFG